MSDINKYDVIIVGGGIAGLTSAAFLSKWGKRVLVCEKDNHVGGLIGTFDYKGFKFDGGIRATENSGILFPMLRQLGIEIEFLENIVSLGIDDHIIHIDSDDSLNQYSEMLKNKFQDNKDDIDLIMNEVRLIMDYMVILYGIDNPVFLDFRKDREYMLKEVIPWVFKYMSKVGKIKRFAPPVDEFLEGITDNRELIDIIAQHFFTKTPASFALSYFSLYLDYKYPKGGTGTIINRLSDYIVEHGGVIKTETNIIKIEHTKKILFDENNSEYGYRKLIWAADNKALYNYMEDSPAARERREYLKDKRGGNSVLSLYLTTDKPPEYFKNISGAHFFYTPSTEGLGKLGKEVNPSNKDNLKDWLADFFRLNTYEISIPVLRDKDMAPEGKTGLIISVLMDYDLVNHISESGWYDEFIDFCKKNIIQRLDESIYGDLKEHIIDEFIVSPLTLKNRKGNTDGAITGWAFTNDEMPAVSKMISIAKSVKTPFKDILQAGQWTYSPSGMPISVLTGKLAADKAVKGI